MSPSCELKEFMFKFCQIRAEDGIFISISFGFESEGTAEMAYTKALEQAILLHKNDLLFEILNYFPSVNVKLGMVFDSSLIDEFGDIAKELSVSALALSAYARNLVAAKFLLERGAYIEQYYNGLFGGIFPKPQHIAGYFQDSEMTQLLTRYGANKDEFYVPSKTSLTHLFSDIYDLITNAQREAKRKNKPLIIMIGEAHDYIRCFYIEYVVLLIARELGITDLHLELCEYRLEKIMLEVDASVALNPKNKINSMIALFHVANKFMMETHLIDDYVVLPQGLETAITPEGMHERNKRMASNIESVRKSCVCLFGLNHLRAMHKLLPRDKFHIVSINSFGEDLRESSLIDNEWLEPDTRYGMISPNVHSFVVPGNILGVTTDTIIDVVNEVRDLFCKRKHSMDISQLAYRIYQDRLRDSLREVFRDVHLSTTDIVPALR